MKNLIKTILITAALACILSGCGSDSVSVPSGNPGNSSASAVNENAGNEKAKEPEGSNDPKAAGAETQRKGNVYAPKSVSLLEGEEVMDEHNLTEHGLSDFLLSELERIGQDQVDYLTYGYEEPPFKCKDFMILKAESIDTGTAGLTESVSIVRYLIGLIPEEYPETLHWNYSYCGDYIVWDTAPAYLIYCTFDEPSPVSHLIWTLTEEEITYMYASDSCIEKYGSRYRAAAMESFGMYKRFVSEDRYDQWGFNYDRDWMEIGTKLVPEAGAVIGQSSGKAPESVEYSGYGYIYEAKYIVYLADGQYFVLPYTPGVNNTESSEEQGYKPFTEPVGVFDAETITDPQAMVFIAAGGVMDVDAVLISDLNIPYGPGSKYEDMFNSSFGAPEITRLDAGYSKGSYFYEAKYRSVSYIGYYAPAIPEEMLEETAFCVSMETTSSFFHTYRGISIGSTAEEIKASYPEIRHHRYSESEPEEYYWFCRDENGFGPNLYLYVESDKVVKMSAFDYFD